MSFSKLPSDVICYILEFLSVEDHSRFSLTCKDYYKDFGITKIERDEGVEGGYEDLADRYTMLLGHGSDDGVLRRVVGLDVKKYTGTTKRVKELVIGEPCEYICGDTIQYIPGSLTGEGLRYLVKLDIDNLDQCTISDVRFERLVALRARDCKIIRCKFDMLEILDLHCSQFLNEMPATIKILRISWNQFSDNCVKGPLVNLKEIFSIEHDFIQYAPNVKKAVVCDVDLHNLPESLEYLRLINVEVHGEEFRLPNLKCLDAEWATIGYIIAPMLSELTILHSEILALDCPPVLDMCNICNTKCDVDVDSVLLMTDRVVDPKKFPKMRALYFYENPEDLGDMIYELDMIYIDRVTAKITANINARVLVTLEIDKDVDLQKMSRLERLIAPAEYAAIVPAPIKFIEFNHTRHGESGFIDLFKELFPNPLNNRILGVRPFL